MNLRVWVNFLFWHPSIRDLMIIVCLVGISYATSLHGPFQFDDHPIIKDNPSMYLMDLSGTSILKALFNSASNNRPISNLTLALNYYFWGMSPVAYHAVNLVIHLLAVIVLYALVYQLLSLPSLQRSYGNAARRVAVLTALLWGLHPVHVQAVTYIVQRMTSQATLFYLLSILLYLYARQQQERYRKGLLFMGVILSGLMALGSKEIALTLPFAILLVEVYFLSSFRIHLLSRNWLVIGLLLLVVVGLGGWIYSIILNYGGFNAFFSITQYPQPMTYTERLLTAPRVIFHYISLLLFPSPSILVLDYDFPLSDSLISPITTLPSIMGFLGLLTLALRYARKWPLLSFCILWFFLNLLLETLAPFLDLVFEHRLYLPSVGVVILIALGMVRLLNIRWIRWPQEKGLAVRTAVIGFMALLFLWTLNRNLAWSDEVILWEDTVRKSPGNSRAHYGLGYAYGQKGLMDEALDAYQKALKIRPDYPDALFGMGHIYSQQGKLDLAVKKFQETLKLWPDHFKARANLGVVYYQLGMTDEAIEELQTVIRAYPNYARAHYNLANILDKEGDYDEAIPEYQEALRVLPTYSEARINLGMLYFRLGKHQEAIRELRTAIQIHPKLAVAYYNLGNILVMQGVLDEAIAELQAAVKLDPQFADAYNNLGIAYQQKGMLEESVRAFQEAIRIAPQHANAHYNLGLVYQKKGEKSMAMKMYQVALTLRPGWRQVEDQIKTLQGL